MLNCYVHSPLEVQRRWGPRSLPAEPEQASATGHLLSRQILFTHRGLLNLQEAARIADSSRSGGIVLQQ